MSTQPACKQAIPVGYMKKVGTIRTISCKSTRKTFCPRRKVLAGVSYYGGLTCSTGRGMNTYDLAHRYGTKSERIIIAQVIFGSKREFHDIIYTINIVRGDSQFLHFLTVERSVVINMLHDLFEANALDFTEAFTIHTFDAFIPNHVFVVLH